MRDADILRVLIRYIKQNAIKINCDKSHLKRETPRHTRDSHGAVTTSLNHACRSLCN